MKSGLTSFNIETAREFTRKFENLFNDGDYRTMASYYTDDAELTGYKLPVYKGIGNIESFWKKTCIGANRVKVYRTIDIEQVIAENDMGYIHGMVYVKFKIIFLRFSKVFKYVTVWKRKDGLWRLAIDISTKVKSTKI